MALPSMILERSKIDGGQFIVTAPWNNQRPR